MNQGHCRTPTQASGTCSKVSTTVQVCLRKGHIDYEILIGRTLEDGCLLNSTLYKVLALCAMIFILPSHVCSPARFRSRVTIIGLFVRSSRKLTYRWRQQQISESPWKTAPFAATKVICRENARRENGFNILNILNIFIFFFFLDILVSYFSFFGVTTNRQATFEGYFQRESVVLKG